MDQGNGGTSLTLQEPEVAEQGGDLARRVFVDGMKPDQGIQESEERDGEA